MSLNVPLPRTNYFKRRFSFRPPEVYEAMRLMFGDRASPYLALYIVRQHAEDNNDDYPLAVAIILLQMYMDDIMTSLETDDEAI